ncbi:MAG TPA: GtrA family protein [Mycobacteriales bacterium]|nr:GtrA family protein [Mycobacteriales bacterium]
MRIVARMGTPWQVLAKEVSAFGVVGAVNVVVDTGVFNASHFWLGLGPTTSNVISTGIATTLSYFANRHWSFSHRARTGLRREYTLFFLLNAAALGMSLVCIDVTFYLLGLTSPLAVNVAKLVGLGFGTVFRFWSYKRWVFLPADRLEDERAAA